VSFDPERFLLSREQFGMRFGLERTERLLERLGRPDADLPATHVVGTNGKSSTARFAAAALGAQGLTVGCFTSPHLHGFFERVTVGGAALPVERFSAAVRLVADAVGEMDSGAADDDRVTQFEAIWAAALCGFRAAGCDAIVAEAGLGGRLDATNVLKPKIAVITNVGLDHTEILGKTIAAIARDKAGIIKRGSVVVTGANGNALKIIEKVSVANHAPLLRLGHEIIIDNVLCDANGSTFCLHLPQQHLHNLRLTLVGPYQAVNAALAIAACSKVVKLDEKKLRKTLATAFVPCRFEIVQRKPLVILDGAHNPMKARALATTLPLFGHKFVFVIGISATKDAAGIIRQFNPLAAGLVFTAGSDSKRFYSPKKLKEIAGGGKVEPNLQKAVSLALSIARRRKLPLVVTGSLYVAGEARSKWRKPD